MAPCSSPPRHPSQVRHESYRYVCACMYVCMHVFYVCMQICMQAAICQERFAENTRDTNYCSEFRKRCKNQFTDFTAAVVGNQSPYKNDTLENENRPENVYVSGLGFKVMNHFFYFFVSQYISNRLGPHTTMQFPTTASFASHASVIQVRMCGYVCLHVCKYSMYACRYVCRPRLFQERFAENTRDNNYCSEFRKRCKNSSRISLPRSSKISPPVKTTH